MNKFGKKQLWYLTTVFGFAIGMAVGWWFLLSYEISTPLQAQLMELFFWVFPAGGAGLGMGLVQWISIRRIHKNTYLWILATAIGVIIMMGGALLILTFASYYGGGHLSWLLSNLPGWFVPLAIITPIIIFTGPFLQWLVLRHVTNNYSFKELLKLGIGWILAIIILGIMFGLSAKLVHTRNDILNSLTLFVTTIPSGLIFAHSTINIIKYPLSESSRL
jgi:uncharacterized Tic20 family protein